MSVVCIFLEEGEFDLEGRSEHDGIRWAAFGRAGPRWALGAGQAVVEATECVDDPGETSPTEAIQLPVLEARDHGLVDAGQSLDCALRQCDLVTTAPDHATDRHEAATDPPIDGPLARIPAHAGTVASRALLRLICARPRVMQTTCISDGGLLRRDRQIADSVVASER
jgi:hypothetical protein